jgi:hypothetical protein
MVFGDWLEFIGQKIKKSRRRARCGQKPGIVFLQQQKCRG